MHTGPKRATYVSRADVQELDLDQIVGKILMRMTPRQFEIRGTHNKVHFILSDEHRCNTLWNETATLTLLGKGPRFIPKAKSLSEDEVRGACARLGYRMVRTFERFIRTTCLEVERGKAIKAFHPSSTDAFAESKQIWLPPLQERDK